ncbi:hypothetical protein [Legionella longbeachae]|uniref:hypothetical protein n=1 Tax=Legionella longbeachae TaxID=450 RepID=UPI001245DFF8|nr:hypothetical protein [Legionella longbeachae]QEY52332.1 hypothetical protein FQU71_14480 [Legionella longbeachae]
MNDIKIEQLQSLVDAAKKNIESSEKILDELCEDSKPAEVSFMEDTVYSIQLVLQYRFSCQDALAILFQLDQNLLYLLGIQPQHTAKMNFDRLAYALGNDDLKQMIHALSLLVSALLKITNHYQKEHVQFGLKSNKPVKQNSIIKGMQKLISLNNHFISLIQQLQNNVKLLLEHQSIGPIFDHIAALRGPISQFYQAILNGIGEAKELYEKINLNQPINNKVDLLLRQAEEVLQIMPSIYKPRPQYTLYPAPKISSEQLEQRATAKRLRPFF